MPILIPLLLAISALAAGWFWRQGYLLYWGDAAAHLNIARHILDSRTPGYDQIGTVWLPLPHVLMLPFVGNDWLWRTGLAGAIPSGICFVAAALFLYGAARRLHGTVAPAIAAVFLFILNPNALYLQSLAMTESVFFAASLGALYCTVRCVERGSMAWAAAAGFACLCASMTRYDGWFLIPFVTAYLLFKTKRLSVAFAFGAVASAGPLFWLFHNYVQFGDPLAFYRGEGSALSIQGREPYPGENNWRQAAQYFFTAARLVIGWPLFLMGAAGVLIAIVRRSIWPIVYLFLVPAFYILTMHSAGTPIFIPTLWPFSYYNTRYGLELLPLAAFAASAIVAAMPDALKKHGAIAVVAVAVLPWAAYPKAESWICWKESQVNSDARREWTQLAAVYMREHYRKGEGILAPFGDLTSIFLEAGIPLRQTLHEGNGLIYQAALQRPDLFLWPRWVVAISGDAASSAMAAHAMEIPRYSRVKMIEVKGASPIEIYHNPHADTVHQSPRGAQ